MLVEKDAGNDALKNEPVICKAPDRLVLIRAILTGKIKNKWGSGCGSIGRADDFDTIGPRFDSSHRQNFIEHLFIEMTKIKKKRPGMANFFKKD